MKLTSKVLNKWYNQFKYEESIMQSVCHRDYIISMYEILGNTKDSKQFSDKYHSVFTFMLNRYLKQWMTPELKNNLKKVVLMLKKDKTSFVMVDFTEEERQKATHMKHNHKFISPIKVEISSPSHSGRVTPVRSQIFIEEQDSLAPVSPQNYSFIVDWNKNLNKCNFLDKLDSNSDYIVRQCIENPHCSKVTNSAIIREALSNRIGRNSKPDDLASLQRSVNSCIIIPVKINDGEEVLEANDTLDMHSFYRQQIGTLELYFKDANNKIDTSQFEDEKVFHSLNPIFNLLRDIVVDDTKEEELVENTVEESKIDETQTQLDESKISMSASFLDANKKTSQDSLMYFTQSTKLQPSFSKLLLTITHEIPKILGCEKSLVILVVEGPTNILGGVTKIAYFYSFTDNHTYNFNYDGTFVEKILDTHKPVGFTVANQNTTLWMPASIKNSAYAHYPKNISNESYHTIRYLPVSVTKNNGSKVIAILETWYSEASGQHILSQSNNDHSYISEIAEDEKIISILDQNTSLLSGFAEAYGKSELEERQINADHRNVEFQCTKVIGKRLTKTTKNLRFLLKTIQKGMNKQQEYTVRVRFAQWAAQTQRYKNMKVDEYSKELDQNQIIIDQLKKQNLNLHEDLNNVSIQQAKSRHYKAAAKIIAITSDRIIDEGVLWRYFELWKSDTEMNRLMENAFNKVLEMRHDNINDKLVSGTNLLNYVLKHHIKNAFNDIKWYDQTNIIDNNRSPTPKFNHTNLLSNEDYLETNMMMNDQSMYSSSLHDSTLFLSRCQEKYKRTKEVGKKNKSQDNASFMF